MHLNFFLFGQTTKHRWATQSPENIENTSNFEGWGLTLTAYEKISDCAKKLETYNSDTKITQN